MHAATANGQTPAIALEVEGGARVVPCVAHRGPAFEYRILFALYGSSVRIATMPARRGTRAAQCEDTHRRGMRACLEACQHILYCLFMRCLTHSAPRPQHAWRHLSHTKSCLSTQRLQPRDSSTPGAQCGFDAGPIRIDVVQAQNAQLTTEVASRR